ncbi:hypothetical protein EVAR_56128_1 [Eumeta japonica]|uniref:Uncharacterized protein n=1 Tax=Eumeta variegata TaxID=151549 RepID=A0A4C1Z7F3_EUMVA|nr:hypothetical protein EVAR_56128_1 [Eumeta japonica]
MSSQCAARCSDKICHCNEPHSLQFHRPPIIDAHAAPSRLAFSLRGPTRETRNICQRRKAGPCLADDTHADHAPRRAIFAYVHGYSTISSFFFGFA